MLCKHRIGSSSQTWVQGRFPGSNIQTEGCGHFPEQVREEEAVWEMVQRWERSQWWVFDSLQICTPWDRMGKRRYWVCRISGRTAQEASWGAWPICLDISISPEVSNFPLISGVTFFSPKPWSVKLDVSSSNLLWLEDVCMFLSSARRAGQSPDTAIIRDIERK